MEKMVNPNPFHKEIRSLQEENKNLLEELNDTRHNLIYYTNRCIFLQNIIKKLLRLKKKLLN
jgi:hypothetical protein